METKMICGEVSLSVAALPDRSSDLLLKFWESNSRINLYTNRKQVDICRDGTVEGVECLDYLLFAKRNGGLDCKVCANSSVYMDLECEEGRDLVRIRSDQFGVRPIYFWKDHGRAVFSTSISGIEAIVGDLRETVSRDALVHYYHFGFTASDRTLVDGIRKLPAGTTLVVNAEGNLAIERCFDLASLHRPLEFVGRSEHDIARVIDEALAAAVRRTLPPNAKVGIALSGGLDSGYLAQKLKAAGADVVGYTLGYEGAYNEFQRVGVLAKELDLEVRKIVLSPEDILATYEAAAASCSEPVSINNGALRAVAVAAQRDGVSVLFDGDGADRLFLGMNRYRQYQQLLRAFAILERLRLTPLALPILNRATHPEAKKASLLFRNWRNGLLPYPERDLSGTKYYDPAHEQALYDLAIAEKATAYQEEFGEYDFGTFFTYVSITMCPEMFFHAPAQIQADLGLFSMPAFWDDELVSIAISLPTHWKLKQGKTKYILRKAATRALGSRYSMLPKIGLQSAYDYVVQSDIGREWRDAKVRQVETLEEFAYLRETLPGGYVDPEKLIPYAVWKSAHSA